MLYFVYQIYVSDHFNHRYVFPGIQIITEGKSPHRHEDTKVLQGMAIGWVSILFQLLFCSIQGLWCFEMQEWIFFYYYFLLLVQVSLECNCWHNCQWDHARTCRRIFRTEVSALVLLYCQNNSETPWKCSALTKIFFIYWLAQHIQYCGK